MNGWTDDAHYFEETINISRVKKLLDNAVGEKGVPKALEGMKWLLAQISKGRDVSNLFSSVVKIVSTKSVELKKMVYMFLVHYVDANKTCRELALLAINSYQKDLADRNQLIRALALRVLTSFRVPEICQIQLLAMRKCATDRSPFVRKTTAHSVPKLYVVFVRVLKSPIFFTTYKSLTRTPQVRRKKESEKRFSGNTRHTVWRSRNDGTRKCNGCVCGSLS